MKPHQTAGMYWRFFHEAKQMYCLFGKLWRVFRGQFLSWKGAMGGFGYGVPTIGNTVIEFERATLAGKGEICEVGTFWYQTARSGNTSGRLILFEDKKRPRRKTNQNKAKIVRLRLCRLAWKAFRSSTVHPAAFQISFGSRRPSCLKKNGTPAISQLSLMSLTHSFFIGRRPAHFRLQRSPSQCH